MIKYFFLVAYVFRFLQRSTISKIDGSEKKYPKVIQLPITYKCNSKCVMCHIWKMASSNEAKPDEFGQFIQSSIFKEVHSVGVNGGEPSLVSQLPEYTKEILNLPKLKNLNVISNGFCKKSLLESLEKIYDQCRKKGVKFHVSISLDGYSEIHDAVRGVPGVFKKTISTLDEMIENKHKYFDSYDVGCTVVMQNINHLMALDNYAKSKNYHIKYRLGIENKRIESHKFVDQFSVLSSPFRQTAKEFFHYQMSQSKSFEDKFKYFSIFSWLDSTKPKRFLGCTWKDEGITMDSRGELYYCAVASESIGSLRNGNGESIFFDEKNINYRKKIIINSCDGCIHDYSGKPELKHVLHFLKELLFQRTAMTLYRLRAWLL